MIAICIISAILLLLLTVALLPASLTVKYREEICAEVSFLGKSFRLYPKEKKKIKISDYSKEKIEKRRKKAERKRLKAARKKTAAKKSTESTAKKAKKTPLESIGLIKELLSVLIPKTAKRVKIKASRIIVNVGSDDAAKTALLFPAINGAVLGLVTYLDNADKFVGLDKSTVAVRPDFVSEKITADIEISFSLRVWHTFELLFAAALKYVTQKTMK